MIRQSFGATLLACLLSPVILGCGSGDSKLAPAGRAPANVAEVPFPIPVIEMAGTPAEMGNEHGWQMGSTIRGLHGKYLKAYFSSEGRRVLAMMAAATFEQYLSPEHRDELRALASSAGVEERQMLLAHCFLDLSPMTACSTVTLPAIASPDGVARFGRNLDFPSFDVADKLSVVQIYRPAGKNAFMSVGWPGMAGVLSGMNEHGLTLANMEVTRGRRMPTAMPYILLYRTVLERCRTVDEAIELLGATPRQTANNLMLMDAGGDRAVVEITPKAIHVRRAPAAQPLVSTNHQRGDDLDTPGSCRRFDCILKESARQSGKIDAKAIQSILAEASQGKKTLQSMVFEPSTRILYLSTGENAARKPFYRLDLKPYFAKGKPAVASLRARG